MSLNRKQWTEMWNSIKNLERFYLEIYNGTKTMTVNHKRKFLDEIHNIKEQIQNVIGQME